MRVAAKLQHKAEFAMLIIRSALILGLAASLSLTEGTAAEPARKSIRGILVLVDFSDAPATISVQKARGLINKPDYTEKTIGINFRDYWLSVSRGKCDYKTDIFGYFRAPHPTTWYNEKGWQASVKLTAEAMAWVVKNNPKYDWDALSLDHKKTFLAVTTVYSKRIKGSGGTHHLGKQFVAPNGVSAGQCVGTTLTDFKGKKNSLFVILHEHGHMVWGWPDLYNTKGGRGTGDYDVMSGNHFRFGPPNPSLLLKEGWIKARDITKNELITLTENGDVVARYTNPSNPKEYFLIEAKNKSHVTTDNLTAPCGLMIWHIDENVRTNHGVDSKKMSATEHYRVSLEQADGKFDLENGKNGGDKNDLFGPGKRFANTSKPDSKWWSDARSGLTIEKIEFLSGGKIRFRAKVLTKQVAQTLRGQASRGQDAL
jgi:M6 family metalloprotease-like protein